MSAHPHRTAWLPMDIFSQNLIFDHLKKTCQKIQVSLKSDKIIGTLLEDLCTFVIVFYSVLLGMRNVSGKIHRENPNTHFVFNNFFLIVKS
jgi:hypothetical protein